MLAQYAMVGNIFLTNDGSINFDKIDSAAQKNTRYYLYPAVPDTVMVTESSARKRYWTL